MSVIPDFTKVDLASSANQHDTLDDWIAEAEADAGFDSDRFCLDCLALAGLGILLPVLAFCFFAQPARQPLPRHTALFFAPRFSSPYLTRAPPLA